MVDGQEGAGSETGTPSGGTPWHSGIQGETLGYITNRGLDKLSEREALLKVIDSHRAAESKLGVPADQLLRLPKDQNDQAGWNSVWERMGRPKDPNGYDFSGVQGTGEEFQNFVRDFAYKHNLPKSAGEALLKEFTAYADKMDQSETQEAQLKVEQERNQLRQEFGLNYNAMVLTAQNAVKALGIDPAAVAALEGKVGYAAVMKMFHTIGQKIGEDKFITSERTGTVMTAQGAKERIAQLKGDKDWVARYLNGGVKEKSEMADLLRLSMGMTGAQ